MLTLRAFLESAPKPLLKEIHAFHRESKGLLSNSRLLPEVLECLSPPRGFLNFLQTLESWQLRCLRCIYASGQRGMELRELLPGLDLPTRELLPTFLSQCAREIYLHRKRQGSVLRWCGFAEFAPLIWNNPQIPSEIMEPGLDQSLLVESHLQSLAARIFLNRAKLSATRDLHKRFQSQWEQSLHFSRQLADSAASEELILYFSYLQDQGFVLCNESGDTRLSAQYLLALEAEPVANRPGHQHLVSWWVRKRLQGDVARLQQCLKIAQNSCPIATLAQYWWSSEPNPNALPRNSLAQSYECLPQLLREAWILGLLQFHMAQGRIVQVSPGLHGKFFMSPPHASALPVTAPTFTPNLEWIIPLPQSGKYLFLAHILAEPLNDEAWLRMQLRKESFLAGLCEDLPLNWVESLVSQSGLLRPTLQEWLQSYLGASIQTEKVLRIKDTSRWQEISEFPLFREVVKEAIPHWGFLLLPHKETRARELLLHFGLQPETPSENSDFLPLARTEWMEPYHRQELPVQVEYDLEKVSVIATPPLPEGSKYSHEFKKMDLGHLTQVLRYAMVTDTLLEAELRKGNSPLQFRVESLHLRKEPYMVSITMPDASSHQIDLNHIERLRLLPA